MEYTNWREREQASNLCRLTTADPAGPLLVWCGNGHATKVKINNWVPMDWHFPRRWPSTAAPSASAASRRSPR
jgi:hypothetical protein